jgi:hypothetical protein
MPRITGALARRAIPSVAVLASQLVCLHASAAEFFQWLDPVVGGQVSIGPSVDTFATATQGQSFGRLGSTSGRVSRPETDTFWVGFQIPTQLQYAVTGVGLSGSWGASGFFNSTSVFAAFGDISSEVPPIGTTWHGFDSGELSKITALAQDIASSGSGYGFFSDKAPSSTGSNSGPFSVQGNDALVANLIAKQGDILYIGVTGGPSLPDQFINVGFSGLQLFTNDPNVSVVPIPGAGLLLVSALLFGLGIHTRSRKAAADLPS